MTTKSTFRILLPVDGSPIASQAIAYAGHLPASECVLLHVLPDIPLTYLEGTVIDAQVTPEEVRPGIEALAEPLRRAGIPVSVDIRTSHGSHDVADIIIEASADFDLVVMTSHGRGAAERLIFGSVSDRVTRHGSVPALIVRVGNEDTVMAAPARIVVPLDGSELAEVALSVGARLAGGCRLPVHLVRVVTLDDVRRVIRAAREAETAIEFETARVQAEQDASDYLDNIATRLQGDGLTVETSLLHGTASVELLDGFQSSDLMVMTSHGAGGFKRWLIGSVSEKLVREARFPVVLVPSERQ